MDSVTRHDEDSVQEFFVPRTRAARVEKDEDEGEGAEENKSKVDDVERSHRVFLTKSQSGGFCFRICQKKEFWVGGNELLKRGEDVLFHWQSIVW